MSRTRSHDPTAQGIDGTARSTVIESARLDRSDTRPEIKTLARQSEDYASDLSELSDVNASGLHEFKGLLESSRSIADASAEGEEAARGHGLDHLADTFKEVKVGAQALTSAIEESIDIPDDEADGTTAAPHVLSQKTMLEAKSFSTDAAILVLDKYQAREEAARQKEGKPPLDRATTDFLDNARAFLKDRRDDMRAGRFPDRTIAGSTGESKKDAIAFMGSKGTNEGIGHSKESLKAEKGINALLGGIADKSFDFDDLDLPFSTEHVREDGAMTLLLDRVFEVSGLPRPSDMEAALLDGRKASLNGEQWTEYRGTVEQRFGDRRVAVDCAIKPQSQLGNVFAAMGGKGVNCHMAQSVDHVTNLAATSATIGGKAIFSGIRHGTLAAYEIKDSVLQKMEDEDLSKLIGEVYPDRDANGIEQTIATIRAGGKASKTVVDDMRQVATDRRGMDVVTSALVSNADKMTAALNWAPGDPPIDLNITSVSLLTPSGKVFGKIKMTGEREMWNNQLNAWNKASGLQTITIVDGNGAPKDVEVNVGVRAFNFGVNKLAINLPLTKFGLTNVASGWGHVRDQNTRAMAALIGDKASRKPDASGAATFPKGSAVGAWLDTMRQAGGLQDGSGAETEAGAKVRQVEELAAQVAAIWDSEAYRGQGREPYKLVSRLAVLTDMIGDTPAWNCKSGKDRTGELDLEAKYLATQIAQDGKVPDFRRKRSAEERRNFFDMALGCGNHEVQKMNTGAPGYKVNGVPNVYNLMARDKSESKERVSQYKALSGFFGS